MNTDKTPYQIRWIWAKRRFNAEGYVTFWKEHVKKLPDKFALTMLAVAEKTLEKVNEEFKKVEQRLEQEIRDTYRDEE